MMLSQCRDKGLSWVEIDEEIVVGDDCRIGMYEVNLHI